MVNGTPIPVSRVQLELDRMRRGTDEGSAQVAAQDIPRLARALLDGLIDRTLVLQRARAAGLSVSEAEVQQATDALVDDARRGGAAWKDQLAQSGQSSEQLSNEMRERLLAARYVAEQTRAEHASPAETHAYYDTHKSSFSEPEAVHCLQIALRSAEEAKSALDQIRAGSAFERVAQKMGTTPDARNGGDLGFISRGTMPKAFEETCFSLGTGKISGIVQSSYGFHVFKALGRRPARMRRFEDVQVEAERRATAEKRAQAERQLLGQLRASATVKIDESSLALLH
jgi:peptidyl-prolyl cis-trans isomerase C